MVRIVAGRFKGVTLVTPPHIRATEGKVRQALFNILAPVIEGARVLDGFAGSGALGFEALSRGAAFVTFLEADTDAVMAIRDNLERLAPELDRSDWRVVHAEVERGLRQLARAEAPYDLIFFDPPYRTEEAKKALNTVVECATLAPTGIIAIEHDRRTPLPTSVGGLRQMKQHRYGDTVLSFFQSPSRPDISSELP